MKIIVDQKNGLGNQLFQYAAAVYFAEKYGASLEVVLELEKNRSNFGHPRTFLLGNFRISAPASERTDWDRLICSMASHKRLLAQSARTLSRSWFYHQPAETFNKFVPELRFPRFTRVAYLNGNFQAQQFAQSVEGRLRSELVLKEPMCDKSQDVLAQIEATESPVSLHVRYGDYKLDNGGKSLMPMTYYKNAIRALEERIPNPTYFVFSDDIALARENLPKLERAYFVGHNAEDAAHEDMCLMAACSHHIIANSTFSWWGAWLDPSAEKVVIMPDRWFNLNPIDRSLVPAGWLTVPVGASSSQ